VTDVADVTVTISTLDRPQALARCLEGLMAGRALPAEIIVVDQGDGREAQAVVERHQDGPVTLRYIHQRRRGLSISRNTALQQATRSIVAVTDDDCVPDPGWIANLERAFAAAARPEAVTGRVLPLGPAAPELHEIALREEVVPTEYRARALPWLVGSGNNYAVKRDWYAGLGGCDERLGAGSPGQSAEDMDLFYKLLRRGARICYDPQVVVYHERQTSDRRLSTRASYGYGMGAFCSMWLRRGDGFALYVLMRWVADHGRQLAGALARRDWWHVRQRALSLGGTIRGLAYGWRVPLSPATSSGGHA
jgi:O-antigen biosynthesis protein